MLQLTRSTSFLRYLTSRSRRFLSFESGGDENGNKGAVNVDKLVEFFKQADEQVAKEAAEKAALDVEDKLAKKSRETVKPIAETPALPLEKQEFRSSSTSTDPSSELMSRGQQKTDDGLRRFSTAPRFVPWTSNRLLKEYRLSRSKAVSQLTAKPKSFATLLRDSTFVQLGNFNQREVVGVVIENVNDSDLYVDFGGKFLAVVSQPENSFYPRGSLVRIRLRDPEMANRFMVNTKAISLLEADATLIGPYRGQLTTDPDASSTSSKMTDSKSGDNDESRGLPPGFEDAVLRPSQPLPEGVDTAVRGFDFNEGINYESLLTSYASIGFQATHFARAVDILNEVIKRKEQMPSSEDNGPRELFEDMGIGVARRSGCTVFLAYTSNMVSSGIREIIRFLVQHNLVDVLVTSAGGVEEDFVKCMAPFYIGDFSRWTGAQLRQLSINRTGNLLVPNDNYVKLEAWLNPIFDQMLEEQNKDASPIFLISMKIGFISNVNWTPSRVIDRLGKEIDNQDSIYYWCHKNGIPVFCPGITDGALGDVLFAHTYRSPPGLRVDVVEDVRRINNIAIYSHATAVVVLGGGIIKHHTLNANLMRNGADYAVYINTASEYDGSDAGARPDEAVSWGKLRHTSEPVKIHGDASLIFPLLVARSFAKHFHANKSS